MTKIPMINELATAVLSNHIDDKERTQLKADAKAFLRSELHVPIADGVELAVVENGDSACHIALPYYSAMDDVYASNLTEEDMEEIQAGEFVFTAIGLAISAAIWGTVGYAADFALNPDKYNEDGTLKK